MAEAKAPEQDRSSCFNSTMAVKSDKLNLLEQWKDWIQNSFAVIIATEGGPVSESPEKNTSDIHWINVYGDRQHCKSAMVYIRALCNPTSTEAFIFDPSFLSDLYSDGERRKIEKESLTVLLYKHDIPGIIEIQGTDNLNVGVALSMLDDLVSKIECRRLQFSSNESASQQTSGSSVRSTNSSMLASSAGQQRKSVEETFREQIDLTLPHQRTDMRKSNSEISSSNVTITPRNLASQSETSAVFQHTPFASVSGLTSATGSQSIIINLGRQAALEEGYTEDEIDKILSTSPDIKPVDLIRQLCQQRMAADFNKQDSRKAIALGKGYTEEEICKVLSTLPDITPLELLNKLCQQRMAAEFNKQDSRKAIALEKGYTEDEIGKVLSTSPDITPLELLNKLCQQRMAADFNKQDSRTVKIVSTSQQPPSPMEVVGDENASSNFFFIDRGPRNLSSVFGTSDTPQSPSPMRPSSARHDSSQSDMDTEDVATTRTVIDLTTPSRSLANHSVINLSDDEGDASDFTDRQAYLKKKFEEQGRGKAPVDGAKSPPGSAESPIVIFSPSSDNVSRNNAMSNAKQAENQPAQPKKKKKRNKNKNKSQGPQQSRSRSQDVVNNGGSGNGQFRPNQGGEKFQYGARERLGESSRHSSAGSRGSSPSNQRNRSPTVYSSRRGRDRGRGRNASASGTERSSVFSEFNNVIDIESDSSVERSPVHGRGMGLLRGGGGSNRGGWVPVRGGGGPVRGTTAAAVGRGGAFIGGGGELQGKELGATGGVKPNLRPIVIDGSNVAMSHGKKYYSARGIEIVIKFFQARGHTEINALVPQFRRRPFVKPGEAYPTDAVLQTQLSEIQILERLGDEGFVSFTPSRRIDGKTITCYDDRFVLDLAAQNGGVVVSNDNYRDLQQENNPAWQPVLSTRILPYTFVGDIFMPPADPLGRFGPSLDHFLMFNPPTPSQNPPQHQPAPQQLASRYRPAGQPGPSHAGQPGPSHAAPRGFNPNQHSKNQAAGGMGRGNAAVQARPPSRSLAETNRLRQGLRGVFISEEDRERIERTLTKYSYETNLEIMINYMLDNNAPKL